MRKALEDAELPFSKIEAAFCAYVYGDSTCGQRVIYQQDKTGIPIFNITNNGCTGSTAVLMARNAIKSGAVDCALAIGFEKM